MLAENKTLTIFCHQLGAKQGELGWSATTKVHIKPEKFDNAAISTLGPTVHTNRSEEN